jgi:hypothetical protein
LSPGTAGLQFGGERNAIAGSLIQDSVAAGAALRQLGDLRLGSFQSIYRYDPVRTVFSKPENIKWVFHSAPPNDQF